MNKLYPQGEGLFFYKKKFLIFMTALKMGGFLYTLHNFNEPRPRNFGRVSYLQILFGMLQWSQQGHPESFNALPRKAIHDGKAVNSCTKYNSCS